VKGGATMWEGTLQQSNAQRIAWPTSTSKKWIFHCC
jgi:hypothetical protein